jgi:hypothetical protein
LTFKLEITTLAEEEYSSAFHYYEGKNASQSLLAVDSVHSYNSVMFSGPSLYDYRAYIMLIHYFSNSQHDINDVLLTNLKQGFFAPDQYGAINDFIAKWGRKKYGDYHYYNVWHTDPDKNNYSEINSRRQVIGLSNLDEQNRNNKLYSHKRNNKTCNSTILLE